MRLLRDASFELGALPPNPRDLSLAGQNDHGGGNASPPAIPAAESALGLRPRSALSSAQVLPEWITSTSPCNDLSANGDNPLNSLSHPRGSPHYAALDDLCTRQQTIEKTLYQRYLQRRSVPPALFLYDVTSSYLEGEQNALGEYGYNRDGKRGKLQIVIGLLADEQGEPLAVRVFAGNTGDPATVAEQIRIVKEQFGVQELVFVGDRGMVKSKGKQALQAEGLRYISALTDPRIRKLLSTGTLQMSLFAEQVCEVEADGVRFVLRKNEAQAARHKLAGQVDMRVEGRTILLERKQAAIDQAMQLAGCYAVVTDVPKERMNEQSVHDTYVSLQKVERDFRLMKTGPLEVRPLFVRKESRTRGHVFCCMLALKLSREIERRLQAAFGTTDTDPHACTVPDAMAALQVHLPEK